LTDGLGGTGLFLDGESYRKLSPGTRERYDKIVRKLMEHEMTSEEFHKEVGNIRVQIEEELRNER
jgi:hypothetical protein